MVLIIYGKLKNINNLHQTDGIHIQKKKRIKFCLNGQGNVVLFQI